MTSNKWIFLLAIYVKVWTTRFKALFIIIVIIIIIAFAIVIVIVIVIVALIVSVIILNCGQFWLQLFDFMILKEFMNSERNITPKYNWEVS